MTKDRNKSRKDYANDFIHGLGYLIETKDRWEAMPRDRARNLCKRRQVAIGSNIWEGLIKEAETMEKQFEGLFNFIEEVISTDFAQEELPGEEESLHDWGTRLLKWRKED